MADEVVELLRYVEVDPLDGLDPLGERLRLPQPGDRVGDRYTLEQLIGSGGQSDVYRALDQLTGSRVALKMMRRSARLEASLEAAALRRVCLAGVARVMDQGCEGHWAYLVTDFIEGCIFPSGDPPLEWQQIEPLFVSTLKTLEHVHQRGLIHGDLKPGNVMVTGTDKTVLLDFGLSVAPALNGTESRGYTPLFSAPEQQTGQSLDARADLFGLGKLCLTALGPDAEIAPHIRALLMALVSPQREQRPQSATEALRTVQSGIRQSRSSARPRRSEPVRFTHEDLVGGGLNDSESESGKVVPSSLFKRTGGEPEAAERIIHELVRAGHARQDGRWTIMTRAASEHYKRMSPHAIEAGWSAPSEASFLARLQRARGMGSLQQQEDVFLEWTLAALEQLGPAAFDRLRLEIEPVRRRGSGLERFSGLIDAAQSCYTTDPGRARARLEALGPMKDRRLEGWRQSLLVQSSSDRVALEITVPAARRWALYEGTTEALARSALWRGRLFYARGDFSDAARAQRQAARLAPLPHQCVTAQLNAASSLLDDGQADLGRQLALAALDASKKISSPALHARALWLERTASYRCAKALTPEVGLVDSVARQGSHSLEGLVSLAEGAIAWRAGKMDLAQSLALRAARCWQALGGMNALDLARALAAASGARVAPRQVQETLHRAMDGNGPKRVRAQTLTLLMRTHCPDDPLARGARSLTLSWLKEPEFRLARTRPHQPWEILSLSELLT